MKAIVGLGNPGQRYRNTWHNFGFWVLDELARRQGLKFCGRDPGYEEGRGAVGRETVWLVKPLLFMNQSGVAVRSFQEARSVEASEILVVLDDVHLPLGRFRIRDHGTSGGHQGLENILEEVGSRAIPRLRCGIGESSLPKDLTDYVLAPADRKEKDRLKRLVDHAAQICEDWVREGAAHVMNVYNGLEEIL